MPLLLLVLMLAFGFVPGASALQIHVFDYADTAPGVRQTMAATGSQILRDAGIDSEWTICRPGPEDCTGDAFVIRIVPAKPARDSGPRTLGVAMVTQQGGKFATLFADALTDQAGSLQISTGTLFAYAAVHEIGHLLLGPGHAHAGIMQPHWNRKDAPLMNRSALRFGSRERAALRDRVLGLPRPPSRT